MMNSLNERQLPSLLTREEMLSFLLEQIYGYLPPKPTALQFEVKENALANYCAGKAVCHKVRAVCSFDDRLFSFPFQAVIPTTEGKHPFFVHANFRGEDCNKYQPTEELIDNGFAVLSFNYTDVTCDEGNFKDGLAGVLYSDGIRKKATDPGKIAMWAWAMQRVLDYAYTISDRLDLRTAVACGHSRLGKTALLAAATDERFSFVCSNDSGCSGAAISREKQGETVQNICTRFPYWFCENYQRYKNNEHAMPFDQHFLLAAIAPRNILVNSASEDAWADPISEQLCCFAAAPAFKNGFVCPDRPAKIGEKFLQGDIGYHLRRGLHYFSREDWQTLIDFVNLHREA